MHNVRTKITELISDLITKTATVVDDQALTVYNHEQFLVNIENLTLPAIAVTFIGRSANRGSGKESIQGIGADVRLGIYIMGDAVPCKGQDGLTKMTNVLDVMDALKSAIAAGSSTAPIGHKWKYVADVPSNMKRKDGAVLMGYMQVWETVQV